MGRLGIDLPAHQPQAAGAPSLIVIGYRSLGSQLLRPLEDSWVARRRRILAASTRSLGLSSPCFKVRRPGSLCGYLMPAIPVVITRVAPKGEATNTSAPLIGRACQVKPGRTTISTSSTWTSDALNRPFYRCNSWARELAQRSDVGRACERYCQDSSDGECLAHSFGPSTKSRGKLAGVTLDATCDGAL